MTNEVFFCQRKFGCQRSELRRCKVVQSRVDQRRVAQSRVAQSRVAQRRSHITHISHHITHIPLFVAGAAFGDVAMLQPHCSSRGGNFVKGLNKNPLEI